MFVLYITHKDTVLPVLKIWFYEQKQKLKLKLALEKRKN